MTETRDTFAGLSTTAIVVWYVLIAISIAIFVYGVARLARKYREGRAAGTLGDRGTRVKRSLSTVLTHRQTRRRDPVAGYAHMAVFYGFLLLFIGTLILSVQDDFVAPVFGWHFWEGWFYKIYSLTLDIAGVLLVGGLLVFAYKRGVQKPFRLRYWRPDRSPPGEAQDDGRDRYRRGDWAFLFFLFFLASTGFLLEMVRVAATNPSFEVWAPVGWLGGQALRGIGVGEATAEDIRMATWWVHGLVALFWTSSIPFTKAVHMLVAPVSIGVRDQRAGRMLPVIQPGAKAEDIGYTKIVDLPPAHLVELDACTKCGKCHAACPATNSGFPLSPRDVVLDLREVAEGAMGIRSSLGIEPKFDSGESILGNPIKPETLWSCMSCMACVEICPVGIEHVPMIVEMRRGLVERGEMDPLLQGTLETIHKSGNSFGESKRKRARWAKELDFEVKDIRKEPAEILWFVGDYASLDPRNQRATRALATLLTEAGVDFGILYDAERNAGNDVRRVGEETLFTTLAEQNIAAISGCEFQRILTSDPHTYNTLKNEYPALGAEWEVVHHSELLLELLESGALDVRQPVGRTVTYHDPCALGRYNGVYDAPRQVIEAAGGRIAEMPRNRDNSFCCGAGGGRIWMQDLQAPGCRRPSESRIDEAVGLHGVEWFVVACPKDVTMYEDAIKTSGHQGEIELRELSEVLLESLQPAEATPRPEEPLCS